MVNMNKEEFIKEVEKLNIILSNEQLNKLEKYYNLLIEWNNKINLTRITEKEEVYLKHFYDSLTLSKVINLKSINTLVDVGTGAGFPGIVLKIAFPNLKITLIDSLQKRVNYLNEIIKDLELDNIVAIHQRAEDHKETYDIVTSRAVASFQKLLSYTHHLINKNGQLIAMKANVEEEIKESKKEFNKYKCKITKIETFYLPKENSIRNLVCISK